MPINPIFLNPLSSNQATKPQNIALRDLSVHSNEYQPLRLEHFSSQRLQVRFGTCYSPDGFPIIDLSEFETNNKTLAKTLVEGLQTKGMVIVENSGVTPGFVDGLHETVLDLFQQPDILERYAFDKAEQPSSDGYLREFTDKINGRGIDRKLMKSGWRLNGKSPISLVPEFPEFGPYCQKLLYFSRPVGQKIAELLDTYYETGNYFQGLIEPDSSPYDSEWLLINYYQPLEGDVEQNRDCKHADFTLFTIFTPASHPGLKVLIPETDTWKDVHLEKNQIAIIAGTQLYKTTYGSKNPIPSTVHAVVGNAHSARSSAVVFFFPQPGKTLNKIATGEPQKLEPRKYLSDFLNLPLQEAEPALSAAG